MNLTDNEVEFLTRFLGGHFTGSDFFTYHLYLKLFNHAKFRGLDENTLDTPLNLENVGRADREVFLKMRNQEYVVASDEV